MKVIELGTPKTYDDCNDKYEHVHKLITIHLCVHKGTTQYLLKISYLDPFRPVFRARLEGALREYHDLHIVLQNICI